MWTIEDLIIAAIGVLLAASVLIIIVRAFYPERAEYEQPMGDATETPNVIHMTRRANHAKRL